MGGDRETGGGGICKTQEVKISGSPYISCLNPLCTFSFSLEKNKSNNKCNSAEKNVASARQINYCGKKEKEVHPLTEIVTHNEKQKGGKKEHVGLYKLLRL